MNQPDVEVRDVPSAGRYEIRRDGEVVGFASYREIDGRVVVPHVEVDPTHGGQGLGGRLVRGMLDDLRQKGRTVSPMCTFASGWIRRHPEYHDLVA